MILRAGGRMRQGVKAELGNAVLEFLQVLAAEVREDEIARRLFALARDEGQHEARHQRVVEPGHRAIAGERAFDFHDAGAVSSASPTSSCSNGVLG